MVTPTSPRSQIQPWEIPCQEAQQTLGFTRHRPDRCDDKTHPFRRPRPILAISDRSIPKLPGKRLDHARALQPGLTARFRGTRHRARMLARSRSRRHSSPAPVAANRAAPPLGLPAIRGRRPPPVSSSSARPAAARPPCSNTSCSRWRTKECRARRKSRRTDCRSFCTFPNHADKIHHQADLTLAQAVQDSLTRFRKPIVPAEWVRRQLEKGQCLVMLDGLDQVADPSMRAKVVEWVETQMRTYSNNRYIVASRPYGYQVIPCTA